VTITPLEPKTVEAEESDDFDLDIQISILPDGAQPVGRHSAWWSCAACISITSWPGRCC
jgi:hypothetical protein